LPEADVDKYPRERQRALLEAVRRTAVALMSERGYTEFLVISDEPRILGRLGVPCRSTIVDRGAIGQHLYFDTGDREGVLVRVGAEAAPEWPHRPTLHVGYDGTVRIWGPTRGAFILTLAACVKAAVEAAPQVPPDSTEVTVSTGQTGAFLPSQIISPCLAGPFWHSAT
jgi:hypothetical protein